MHAARASTLRHRCRGAFGRIPSGPRSRARLVNRFAVRSRGPAGDKAARAWPGRNGRQRSRRPLGGRSHDHADRWTVSLELPHDPLNALFALSLIDGTDFDSVADAAEAVHAAIALDLKHART